MNGSSMQILDRVPRINFTADLLLWTVEFPGCSASFQMRRSGGAVDFFRIDHSNTLSNSLITNKKGSFAE